DVTDGLTIEGGYRAYALAISGGKLFCATGRGLFSSMDFGDTWWPIAKVNEYNSKNGLEGHAIARSLFVINEIIYAAFGSNIYMSKDNGIFWVPYNKGLPVLEGNDYNFIPLDFNSLIVQGNMLLGATSNAGIWAIDYVANPKSPQEIYLRESDFAYYGDDPHQIAGASYAGLELSYESSDPSIASIDGNKLIIHDVGTLTITASQSGNDLYEAAEEAVQEFRVNPQYQRITFPVVPQKTFGDDAFNLSAVSNLGLEITYSSSDPSVASINGNVVTIKGGGSTTITASQAGNRLHAKATDKTQVLTVAKANQSINFLSINEKSFSDRQFDLTASSTSGLTITYSSSNPSVATIQDNKAVITGVGSTIITASQSGSNSYNAASEVNQDLIVKKGTQSITFDVLPEQSLSIVQFLISATASSGLPVAFTTTSDKINIDGNQIKMLTAGRANIDAVQSGDDHYTASEVVSRSFCIDPLQPSISVTTTDGQIILSSSSEVGNQWYLNDVQLEDDVNHSIVAEQPGNYSLLVQVDDCKSEISAAKEVIITGDIADSSGGRIQLYPNPTTESLNVRLPGEGLKQVIVYSSNGRSLEQVSTANNQINIVTAPYESGVYLVRVLSGNKYYSEKFVKK
ncbi:MAG TPA: T9SS type A sorting domain-containing protein, partial [Cyclobacteriaceae bacterium]